MTRSPEQVLNQQHIMSFSITPYGVLARIRIVELDDHVFADLGWSSPGTERYWLVLAPQSRILHPSLPLYDIGGRERLSRDLVRLVTLRETDEVYRRGLQQASWKEVYLTLHPPSEPPSFTIPINTSLRAPIHIPERHIAALRDDLDAALLAIKHVQLPWTGSPPTEIVLHPVAFTSAITVQVGRCFDTHHQASPPFGTALSIWASVKEDSGDPQPPGHHALADHIVSWPEMKRRFDVSMSTDTQRALRTEYLQFEVSFTHSPLCHADTLVMDIQFHGVLTRTRTSNH